MKEPYLTELPGFIDLDYMKGIADNMLTDEWKTTGANKFSKTSK